MSHSSLIAAHSARCACWAWLSSASGTCSWILNSALLQQVTHASEAGPMRHWSAIQRGPIRLEEQAMQDRAQMELSKERIDVGVAAQVQPSQVSEAAEGGCILLRGGRIRGDA